MLPRPVRDVAPDFGQRDRAAPPLDELAAKLTFKLLDLQRERRLADMALLRGAAEMPVAGERRRNSATVSA
jgi:hypothetical protein